MNYFKLLAVLFLVIGMQQSIVCGRAQFTNLTDQPLSLRLNFIVGKQQDLEVAPGKTASFSFKRSQCINAIAVAVYGKEFQKLPITSSSIRKGGLGFSKDLLSSAMQRMTSVLKTHDKTVGYTIDNGGVFNGAHEFMNTIITQRTSKYPGFAICKDVHFGIVYNYEKNQWVPYLIAE